MGENYKIRNQEELYFITSTVVKWVDVFTKNIYRDILLDSFKYCQRNKGLEIYGWCIMPNHFHLIVGRIRGFRIEDIVRDMKKYTSVKILRAIVENKQESRREWLLEIFEHQARKSSKHHKYHFWINSYHPIELSTNSIQEQKLDYIHNNPVKAGWVLEPHHYLYSSAIDYHGGKGLIPIKFIQ